MDKFKNCDLEKFGIFHQNLAFFVIFGKYEKKTSNFDEKYRIKVCGISLILSEFGNFYDFMIFSYQFVKFGKKCQILIRMDKFDKLLSGEIRSFSSKFDIFTKFRKYLPGRFTDICQKLSKFSNLIF